MGSQKGILRATLSSPLRGRSGSIPLACLGALLAAAAPAGAAVVGPGLVGTAGADSGDRLNVDDTFSLSLPAGTYDVDGFSYNSTGTGNVVPFLATLSATNTYQLVWVGSAAAGTTGTTSITDPVGGFTLGSATTVYGGFYTTGGRVAFTAAAGQTTDHASTVVAPKGGVAIGSFSNPDLNRTYAFGISATATPRRVIGPGFLSNANADGGDRLNVDEAHPLALAAGTYDVADFSYVGTSATGTVRPFLARLTGTNTYQAVWVGDPAADAVGGVTVDPTGGFTLAASDTLYAGFYTAGGATVAFTEGPGRPPGFGVTDHSGTFTGPTAAGDTIGGFSNPDLARQYSFSIGVGAVPEPSAAAALAIGGLGLSARRRRRRD